MNIIFYSVYDRINQRALDILKVNVHSYDRTNTQKVKWIIFYFEEPRTVLDIKSKNITFIFKKIKFFKNTLSFRQEAINNYSSNKANVDMLVDCFSYKIKALEILSRTHKFDLICHVDFDLIFIKDISEIFEHAITSDKTVFGTTMDLLKYIDAYKNVKFQNYLSLGFIIFKPQRIYKLFLSSKYLGTYTVDEAFCSYYLNFEDIKNLQLVFKNDNYHNYYIIHLSHCNLSYYDSVSFLSYYYGIYRKEVLSSDTSLEFKSHILNIIPYKN